MKSQTASMVLKDLSLVLSNDIAFDNIYNVSSTKINQNSLNSH